MSLVFSTNQAAAAEPGDAGSSGLTNLLGEHQLVDEVVDGVAEVTRPQQPSGGGQATEDAPASAAEPDPAATHGAQPGDADETSASNEPAERVLHSAAASLPVQVSLDRVGDDATATFGGAASDGRALVRGLVTQARPLTSGADLSDATVLPSLAGPVEAAGAGHDAVPAASTAGAEAPDAEASRSGTGVADQTASSAATADTDRRPGEHLAADPAHTTGGSDNNAPAGPTRRTAPAATDSTYLGGSTGSAGSHAVAEQYELLAAWRPTVPTQDRDAEPFSDDEGRPSVSPD